MRRVLIWDFDGTLGYRTGGWTAAMQQALSLYAPDYSADADEIRSRIQTGFPWHGPEFSHPMRTADQWWADLSNVFMSAYLSIGFSNMDAERMALAVREIYTDPAEWRLYEDVHPTLDTLRSMGCHHLLLTNHVPELPRVLSHLKIDGYFDKVFNSANTGLEKPHLRAFQNVLDYIGETGRAWMIGDSYIADVEGARAAGIPGILVRKIHLEANYCLPDIKGVPEIVTGFDE